MKNFLLSLGFLLFPFLLNAQEQHHDLEYHWLPNREKNRVVTYNVLSALDDNVRAAKLTEWLKKQDVEVSAFQELEMSQKAFSEAAEKWGHPYAVILRIGISSKNQLK